MAEGLSLPVNLAFVPEPGPAPGDPFLYFTELYGRVMVMTNDGTVSVFADNLLNFNPLGFFPGAGEQGLGGLTVDPENGDLWLSLLYDAGGPHYPRLERLTSVDGGLTMATRTTVLDMPGEAQGQHYVSHIELNADGTVLLHMGTVQHGTARNLDSFRGKILRLNRDGTPVASNPFHAAVPRATTSTCSASAIPSVGARERPTASTTSWTTVPPSTASRRSSRPRLRVGRFEHQHEHLRELRFEPRRGLVNLAFVEQETFGGSGFPSSKWDHAFVSGAGTPTPRAGAARQEHHGIRARRAGEPGGAPTQFVRYPEPAIGRGRLCRGPERALLPAHPEAGNDSTAPGARILRALPDATGCGPLGAPTAGPQPNPGWSQPLARGSDVVTEDNLTLEGSGCRPTPLRCSWLRRPRPWCRTRAGARVRSASEVRSDASTAIAVSTLRERPDGRPPELPAAPRPHPRADLQLPDVVPDFTLFPTSNFTDGRSITFR